jgi:hypothetical protein
MEKMKIRLVSGKDKKSIRWFMRDLNKCFFGSKLPVHRTRLFILDDADSWAPDGIALGRLDTFCNDSRYQYDLGISQRALRTEDTHYILTIVAHEMIHMAIEELDPKGEYPEHGKQFKSIRRRLMRSGLMDFII